MEEVKNLYVHFPFCRNKCTYCALHSRAGSTAAARAAYVGDLVSALPPDAAGFSTVYFGGGSPALCDLTPLLKALAPRCAPTVEFTVELHPRDVTPSLLATLRAGGVNRLSMGVQSLDDTTLAAMGRGYTLDEARRAFDLLRGAFDNAGIDLIVGYPGDALPREETWSRLADWGLAHASVYSLIVEEKSILASRLRRGLTPPPSDDDATMDALRRVRGIFAAIGLARYEISNYAKPGRECRHNLAVWRGEDYLGLGEGACGRLGLVRTRGTRTADGFACECETLTPDEDLKERTIFRLRTREGLDTAAFPAWRPILDRQVAAGVLTRRGEVYFLTARGAEICDTVLAEIV